MDRATPHSRFPVWTNRRLADSCQRSSAIARWLLPVLVLLAGAPLRAAPQQVFVGVHLKNVEAIELQNNSYYLHFYVWLKWKGSIDPTETMHMDNLIDAWAITKTAVYPKPILTADGFKYQRFIVEGRFFHKFWIGTFPLDWQKVTLELGDRRHTAQQLVFVADPQSAVDPELKIPGWRIVKTYNESRLVTIGSALGEGRGTRTVSQYRFGIKIQRPISFYLLKVIPAILITLLCCFLVFLIDVDYADARIGTPVAVLLTQVFLYLSFVAPLPNVGILVLLDYLFNFAYFTVFLVLLVCIWTTAMADQRRELTESLEADAENTALQSELSALEARIARIQRRSLIGFPIMLVLGILVISGVVRGGDFFKLLFGA